MRGKLPELSYHDLVRLLRRFSTELNDKGVVLTGRNRNDEPFTVHQHPQGNRMKSEKRMVFALKGQPESSPVASALGPRRREVPPSPERTAEAGSQSSFQDFGRPARSRTQG